MPSFEYNTVATTPEMNNSRKRTWESPNAPSPKSQPSTIDTRGDNLKLGCISRTVFLTFVKRCTDSKGKQVIDVSGILSRKCYETWLRTRRNRLQHPEESFRRAITAHVIASDGRKAFPPEVEALLLKQLRQAKIWECFRECNGQIKKVRIGQQGFRSRGYHENNGYVHQEVVSEPVQQQQVEPAPQPPVKRVKYECEPICPSETESFSFQDVKPIKKSVKLERQDSEFTTNAFMSVFDEQFVPSPTSITAHHGAALHDALLHFESPSLVKTTSTDSISRLFSDFHHYSMGEELLFDA